MIVTALFSQSGEGGGGGEEEGGQGEEEFQGNNVFGFFVDCGRCETVKV